MITVPFWSYVILWLSAFWIFVGLCVMLWLSRATAKFYDDREDGL